MQCQLNYYITGCNIHWREIDMNCHKLTWIQKWWTERDVSIFNLARFKKMASLQLAALTPLVVTFFLTVSTLNSLSLTKLQILF